MAEELVYNSIHTGVEIDEGISKTKQIVNPNLLDNAYFLNPVNQRGQTSFVSTVNYEYFLDRWIAYRVGTSADVVSNGVSIAAPSGGATYLLQRLEKTREEMAGKIFTVSAVIGDELVVATGVVTAGSDTAIFCTSANAGNTASVYLNFNATNGMWCAVQVAVGVSALVKAIKLELGSQQTLAHEENGEWVLNEIPDYGEQLARCQRYQLVLDCTDAYEIFGSGYATSETYLRLMVPTPVSLRAVPAFSHTLTNFDAVGAGSTKSLMAATAPTRRLKPNAVLVYYSGLSGLATNETYALQGYGGKIIFDANL